MRKHLQFGEDEMLFCGVALGFEDTSAKINEFRADRCPESEYLFVHSKL